MQSLDFTETTKNYRVDVSNLIEFPKRIHNYGVSVLFYKADQGACTV